MKEMTDEMTTTMTTLEATTSENYISQIAHEAEAARWERTTVRMWIVILVLIVLFVGTNVAWIIRERRFETVETTETITQEADGNGNNFYKGGVLNYGEADSD